MLVQLGCTIFLDLVEYTVVWTRHVTKSFIHAFRYATLWNNDSGKVINLKLRSRSPKLNDITNGDT